MQGRHCSEINWALQAKIWDHEDGVAETSEVIEFLVKQQTGKDFPGLSFTRKVSPFLHDAK